MTSITDPQRPLEGKRILITGGTGSLGKFLIHRLLSDELGHPAQVVVFSRDEAKQYNLRTKYLHLSIASERVIYNNYRELLTFRIGDVRDGQSLALALQNIDVVFNAAALKQVPTCEYFPWQAVLTNIGGAQNIVQTISERQLPVQTVVGISTDKACKPINVMGMTKSLQERIFIQANLDNPQTRFVCVRYGNVLASRGSVIPLFREQILQGGPVTLTSTEMTRFLLSLNQAVDVVFAALREAQRGETYIPRVASARVGDVAEVLIGQRPIRQVVSGIRPGEKLHEILVSEEEVPRTLQRGNYYVIRPILPELSGAISFQPALQREYSSADNLMSKAEVEALLARENLLMDSELPSDDELLR